MSDYKKAGSKKIEGKKTKVVVYKKSGSSKLYVKRKGRMMNFVNYKKMCAKKLAAKKVSKVRKVRKGGSSCSQQQYGGYEENEMVEDEGENTGENMENTSENMENEYSIDGGGKNNSFMKNQNKGQLQKLLKQNGGKLFTDFLSNFGNYSGGYKKKGKKEKGKKEKREKVKGKRVGEKGRGKG